MISCFACSCLARCAGGFTSSMRCDNDQQCPPGLFCDSAINLCCPLLLPLTEERPSTNNNDIVTLNEPRRPQYPNFVAESMPYPSTTATPYTNSYLFPAPPSSTSHFTDYNSNNNYNPNNNVRLKFSQPSNCFTSFFQLCFQLDTFYFPLPIENLHNIID